MHTPPLAPHAAPIITSASSTREQELAQIADQLYSVDHLQTAARRGVAGDDKVKTAAVKQKSKQ